MLRQYVTNRAVNLGGHDMLQQWDIQINIPTVSEMVHIPTHVSGKDIRYYNKKKVINHSGSIKTTGKPSEDLYGLSNGV